MSKSDYWNEKEHEKYERMKAEVQLENLNFEKAKKLSKIIDRVIKIITIPAIIIGVATFILSFLYVILYWKSINDQLNPNVTGSIENIYDEKSKIVSYL